MGLVSSTYAYGPTFEISYSSLISTLKYDGYTISNENIIDPEIINRADAYFRGLLLWDRSDGSWNLNGSFNLTGTFKCKDGIYQSELILDSQHIFGYGMSISISILNILSQIIILYPQSYFSLPHILDPPNDQISTLTFNILQLFSKYNWDPILMPSSLDLLDITDSLSPFRYRTSTYNVKYKSLSGVYQIELSNN